jgi:hypothetical protein
MCDVIPPRARQLTLPRPNAFVTVELLITVITLPGPNDSHFFWPGGLEVHLPSRRRHFHPIASLVPPAKLYGGGCS